MPTYEYVCEKCGHTFEKFQPITARPLTRCPEELCAEKKWGKGRVKRRIGAGAGLIFKGSGFYITDYRSENYKQAAKKESGSAPASPPAPAKTDAKPAPAKTDSKAGKAKADAA